MQTASSRIRTQFTLPISYDDNHYTTSVSKTLYMVRSKNIETEDVLINTEWTLNETFS